MFAYPSDQYHKECQCRPGQYVWRNGKWVDSETHQPAFETCEPHRINNKRPTNRRIIYHDEAIETHLLVEDPSKRINRNGSIAIREGSFTLRSPQSIDREALMSRSLANNRFLER